MVGLLVAFLISWLLVYLADKASIEKLGFIPNRKRITSLMYGVGISALCSCIYFGSLVLLSKSKVTINANFGFFTFIKSFCWTLKSVLFEELLFRGALLYLGIKYLGAKAACIISAIAFGIYHWFSYTIIDNIGQMLTVFILTAMAGLLFAYAFVKTKSMYLQIGLHLGWNIVTIIIFSQGPLGQQYLISTNGHQIGIVMTLVLFAFQLLALPLATLLFLNSRLKV